MEYKGDFSLPFNEKNPLNYVKPITVNIYFKQSNPGVGQYSPSPIKGFENGCSSAFISKQELTITRKPKKVVAAQLLNAGVGGVSPDPAHQARQSYFTTSTPSHGLTAYHHHH